MGAVAELGLKRRLAKPFIFNLKNTRVQIPFVPYAFIHRADMILSFGKFSDSWRSRFLTGRKAWHSHYRGCIDGWRSNFTTISFFFQLNQMQRVFNLLKVVFSRGGRCWTFGLSVRSGYTQWGQTHAGWHPGQFSNSWSNVERSRYIRRSYANLSGSVKSYTRWIKIFQRRPSRQRHLLIVSIDDDGCRNMSNPAIFRSGRTRPRRLIHAASDEFRIRAKIQLLSPGENTSRRSRRRSSKIIKLATEDLSTRNKKYVKKIKHNFNKNLSGSALLKIAAFKLLLLKTQPLPVDTSRVKNEHLKVHFSPEMYLEDEYLSSYDLEFNSLKSKLLSIPGAESGNQIQAVEAILHDKLMTGSESIMKTVEYPRLSADEDVSSFKTSSYLDKLRSSDLKKVKFSKKLIIKKQYDRFKNFEWGFTSLKRSTWSSLLTADGRRRSRLNRQRKWSNISVFTVGEFIYPAVAVPDYIRRTIHRRSSHLSFDRSPSGISSSMRGSPVNYFFPSVVATGGLADKLYSLAYEVENCGIPFIHLYTTRTIPNTAAYGVIWNESPYACHAWSDLVETVWRQTRFNGLLTIFNHRLEHLV